MEDCNGFNVSSNLFLAINAALKAGSEIMQVYSGDFSIDLKDDNSPLTAADKNANDVINSILLSSELRIISEENKDIDYSVRKDWRRYWLVDPLDGTKEFIKRNGEFTVNIALIDSGEPVLGVVYAPVFKELYFGLKELGSFFVKVDDDFILENIFLKAQKLPLYSSTLYTIVASRSHMSNDTEKFIKDCQLRYGKVETISIGSSLKLCLVASGKANAYPRLAPTMEWDTGAAHAIARFCGCKVLDFNEEKELRYNKENLLNPWFIVTR